MIQAVMSLIKQLREMTGAGMLECKKALEETGSNIEKAVDYLRQKGLASMSKRAANKTSAGNFGFYEDDKSACIVSLLCETDFVGNNEIFKKAAEGIAESIVKSGAYVEGAELQDVAPSNVLDSLMQLKENIKIGKVALMWKKEGQHIYHYLHNAGQNRVASMVLTTSSCDYGIGIAVHTACSMPAPVAIRPEDVSDEAIQAEMKFSDSTDANKVRKELSLLSAPFLMNQSKTVAEHLGDAHILEFVRLEISSD